VHYIYDGYLLVQERDASNNVLVTYTRGLDFSGSLQGAGGIGGLLARTDTNGSTYYHADGSGNVTALMNGMENIVGRYLYNPFGKPIAQWGPMAGVNEIRFSSMPAHLLSGIPHLPFRDLDIIVPTFLTADPIGERGGIPLHGFVGNNPINNVDPLGLEGNPISSTLSGLSGAYNSDPFGGGGAFYGQGLFGPPVNQQIADEMAITGEFFDYLAGNTPDQIEADQQFRKDHPNLAFLSDAIQLGASVEMGKMGEPPPPGCKLFRYRNGPESVGRLARKAQEAENKIDVHGVSSSIKDLGPGAQSVDASLVQQYFNVGQTGSDPFHFTIELPKPITPQIANQFNSLPWK
jgi:RHS repeat-associated protein